MGIIVFMYDDSVSVCVRREVMSERFAKKYISVSFKSRAERSLDYVTVLVFKCKELIYCFREFQERKAVRGE